MWFNTKKSPPKDTVGKLVKNMSITVKGEVLDRSWIDISDILETSIQPFINDINNPQIQFATLYQTNGNCFCIDKNRIKSFEVYNETVYE